MREALILYMTRNNAVTVKQIQALDEKAIGKYGVPSIALMENAGRAVAGEVLKSLRNKKNSRVCVFCGLGNNAGDGFVAARHLMNAGVKTDIFLVGQAKKLKNDAAVNCRILKRMNCLIRLVGANGRLSRQRRGSPLRELTKADIIVDAIFGVGLNRDIKEPFAGIIAMLNRSKKRIVSVDIPSGLDGTTGKIHGVCIRAAKTITFSLLKKGFLKGDGPKHTGRVVVVDIGIPKKILCL